MTAYRYSGAGTITTAPAKPDADSILDALTDQLLAQPNVDAALSRVQRTGFVQRDGGRQQGTGELAQKVRQEQRALTRRYSFEELNREYADQVRTAVREELAATEEHFQSRADAREAVGASLAEALKDLAAHTADAPPEGARRLQRHEAEGRYEDLYQQVQTAADEARTDHAEERDRLNQLAALPLQPLDAARELEEYPFLSEDAAERVAQLSAERSQMAGLAAAEWRHAFTGAEPVDADDAAQVVQNMRGLDRLEGQLRGGRLRDIDPKDVAERLGPAAMRAVEGLQSLGDLLQEAGYLVTDGDAVRLTPRAIRRLGARAMREVFTQLKHTTPGDHESGSPGVGGRRGPTVRPYEAGDPFDIHLNETLLAAARRAPQVPLRLAPSDFLVRESEAAVHSATVLMIDLSNTMLRDDRILAAKKVALALHMLISTRFPKDTLELVGFSTTARELTLADLPNVAPIPGQPFTNMQDGLQLATRLLRRHRGANRQVILITDGEPTAVSDGRGNVRSCYPPDEGIFNGTLEAVRACTAHGIVINIVMLDRQPELMEFVRRMAHINRGRALFCTPATIGQYVIFDYLRGKRVAVGGG